MAIQSQFPNLRPSLLLDFANRRSLDPRITFTRASEARYYDGKTVSKAEENLLLRSQDYSATWTVTSLTPVTGKTAPDATSTATEFTSTAADAVLTQGYTAIAGDYTFSVFLRRVTGTGDIQIAADNGTWTTRAITSSWARYEVTQTVTAGAKTAGIRIVTSGDAIEVWGAQLEQRSTVTAYTPTTTQAITNYVPTLLTAPAGSPRFDHNPTTGESLGLLLEEQRTNLFQRSEEFNDSYWEKSSLGIASSPIVTANTAIAPNGTLTADEIFFNCVDITSSANRSFVRRVVTIANTSQYAWSFWIKAADAESVGKTLRVVGENSGIAVTITLTSSWSRISNVGTSSSTSGTYILETRGTVTSSATARIHLWGAQLELGSFATSYIPTVASQVTRSADAASMTGANFTSWYRADEGTLYADINPRALATTSGISINDNTVSNRIRLTTATVTNQAAVTTDGVAQAALNGGTPVVDTNMRLTLGYKTNDFGLSLNGGTVATDTLGTLPVVNQLQIGAESTGRGSLTVKKVAYYPAKLTSAQLQAITT
jgi:hypothetical protein